MLVTQTLPLQQPDGHEVASHTQAPAAQRCPVAQGMVVPQRQAPDVQRSDALPQAAHEAPEVPHCETVVLVMHELPLQHPDGHEVESQTQVPDAQRWPAPQGEFVPHLQAPEVHRSALAPQLVQAAPEAPHWVAVVLVTQLAPLQQPEGHDVASQTHRPPRHRWPAPHAGPLPHRQAPPAQVSAEALEQATQAAPPEPHALTAAPAWHMPLRQQPLAQVDALQPSQALLVQLWVPQF
ncbi:MAG: hypothetical protein Q8N26_34755 [Myxococcales bacterium]|nr:hypothetical protein [Myxococcales bacterium]